jgi:hypothetical protein
MYMLHKLGPALDKVKAWQQAVDPAIDELRQIGTLLPQLMAQLRDSARQIHEFAQQQKRFEVAPLDLHSELQRLKSYRCCAADVAASCTDKWALASCGQIECADKGAE